MPKFTEATMPGPKVALVQSPQALAKLMASIGVYPLHKSYPKWARMEEAMGLTWEFDVDGEMYWVVAVRSDMSPIDTVGVIAHEAVHVWQGWEAFIGEEGASREFEAYSIEAIVVRLLKQYIVPVKKRTRKAPRGV